MRDFSTHLLFLNIYIYIHIPVIHNNLQASSKVMRRFIVYLFYLISVPLLLSQSLSLSFLSLSSYLLLFSPTLCFCFSFLPTTVCLESQTPHHSRLHLISEWTLVSFHFILFLFKELTPFQHICKWSSDVFYNLVNYCFSRQDSRDPEHTWPEGTYLNNCFSCLTQRARGGEGGKLRQMDW